MAARGEPPGTATAGWREGHRVGFIPVWTPVHRDDAGQALDGPEPLSPRAELTGQVAATGDPVLGRVGLRGRVRSNRGTGVGEVMAGAYLRVLDSQVQKIIDGA